MTTPILNVRTEAVDCSRKMTPQFGFLAEPVKVTSESELSGRPNRQTVPRKTPWI
jgi:hypothetical protein